MTTDSKIISIADKLKPGLFLRTGHRGARGLAPENTLFSFQKAIEVGVDLIELDVQASQDGRIVVLHDPTVDRTTNGQGPVNQMTYEKLRPLDAGYRFTPDKGMTFPFRGKGIFIPLLEDVFKTFPQMSFTVEIKPSSHPNFLPTLADILQKYAPSRVIVACESHQELSAIRNLLPGIPTNLSRPEVRRFYFMSKLGVSFLFRSAGLVFQVPVHAGGDDRTGLRVVTPEFIRAAHREGRMVQVWTVNDPAEMRELIELGADGLTTDRPDLLNDVLKEISGHT